MALRARRKRAIVIGGTSVLAALALLVAVVHLPFVRARVLSWTLQKIDSYGLVAQADQLDYNLLTLDFTLHGLRLAAPGRTDDPFFTADRITADLPWSIVTGTISIQSLALVHPQVTIDRTATGSNLPSLRTSGGSSTLSSVPIGRLAVRNLQASVSDRPASLDVALHGLSLNLQPADTGISGPVSLASPARIVWRGRRTSIDTIEGRLAFDGSTVSLDAVRVSTPEGLIQLDGRVSSVISGPSLALDWKGELNLEPLARLTAVETPVSGRLVFSGKASGPATSPEASLDLNGRGLQLASLHNVSLAAGANASASSASLTSLTLNAAGGELTGSAQVSYGSSRTQAGSDMPGRAQFTWKSLDAASLAALLPKQAAAHVTGSLDGSLDARWTAMKPAAVSLTLHNDAHAPTTAVTGLSGSVDLRTEQGRWRASIDQRIGPAVHLAGSTSGDLHDTVGQSTLGGTLQLSVDDLARAWRTARAVGVTTSAPASGLAGSARAELTLAGLLGSPQVRATIDAKDLHGAGVGPMTVTATASGSTDRARLESLTATLRDSHLRASGAIDFATKRVNGEAHGTIADLATLPVSWPGDLNPSGSLKVDATVAGRLPRPTVDASLSGNGLTASGQSFDHLAATLRLANDELTADPVTLTQADGRLDVHATYDLGHRTYTLKAVGRNVAIAPLPPSTPGGASPAPIHAHVDLTLDGSGTLKAPHATGKLDASDLSWNAVDLGSLHATLETAGGSMTANVRMPVFSASGETKVQLQPFGAFTLNAKLAPTDIGPLLARLPHPPPAPVSGSLAVGVTAHGNLSDRSTIAATLDLQKLDGSIGTMPVRLKAPAEIQYANRVVETKPLDLAVGDATLHLSGSLGQPAGDALDARLSGPLSSFNPIVALVETEATGKPGGTTIDGQLDLKAHAEGTLDRPTVTADLGLRKGRLTFAGQPPITGITVDGAYRDGVLTLSKLAAEFQQAVLSATGRMPARFLADRLPAGYLATLPASASGPLRINATFDRLSPELVKPYVSASTLSQIQGAVSGTLDLQADAPSLASTHGTLTLQKADLTLGGVPFSQRKPTRLVLQDGRLQVATLDWGDTTRSGGNELTVSGGATLTGTQALNVTIDGDLDLRMIGAFVPSLTSGGRAQLKAQIDGTLPAPRLNGRIQVDAGALRYPDPQFAVTGLSGTIQLAPDKVTVAGLEGQANGGTLKIAGDVAYRGASVGPGKVTITGRQLALNVKGLRTELDSDLALGINDGQMGLTGSVTVLRGAYREPFTLAGGLLSVLQRQNVTVASGPPSALDAMTLDIKVSTAHDILVDNNYAKLEVGLDLEAGGTIGQPGLTGRATVREGGDIYLGGNTYRIEGNGSVDFIDPTGIQPDLNIAAKTQVSSYDITLNLNGTPQNLQKPIFTSTPSLGEPDIVSLLLTGQTLQQGNVASAAFSSQQVLGYLSGEFLGSAGQAVGLDVLRVQRGLPNVSFDPGLVAAQTDPSSRLTFGKNVTRDLELIFSQSLQHSGGLTWIVNWTPKRTIDLSVTSLDDGTRRYDFMQELNFLGSPAPAGQAGETSAPRQVAEIRFTGSPGESRSTLLGHLKLKAGDTFDFFRWQDDRDRLERYYQQQGYFEASVQTQRSDVTVPASPGSSGSGSASGAPTPATALTYTIEPGPKTTLQVDGYTLPSGVRHRMEQAWSQSIFDQFLLEDLQSIARRYLAGRGYLRAKVDATVASTSNDASKRIDVQIDPGPRSDQRKIVFTGNRQIGTDRLRELVEDQDLARQAWIEPDAMKKAILALYDSQGLLDARVRIDQPRFNGTLAELPVAIDEGPLFQIGSVSIHGTQAKPAGAVRQALDLPAGLIYTPAAVHDAISRVDALYRQDGFNSERASAQVTPHRETGRVDLALTIDEGPRQVLTGVDTSGLDRTSPALVSHALRFKTGEPVNLAAWAQARKRLYDTGVFKSVDIEPVPTEMGPPAPDAQGVPTQKVRAKVTLQEWPALRFRYGFQVQDQQGVSGSGRTVRPGLASDLLYRNLFGRGLSLGVAGQFTKDYWAGRTNLTIPRMFALPGSTNIFLERTHELFNPSASSPYIKNDTKLTAEQDVRQGRSLSFTYGYSFERNHTFDQKIDPDNPFPFDITVDIARLKTTALYDTRNDLVSPTRGMLTSSALEYSAPGLGSNLNFLKYLVQQRYFRPLTGSMIFATSVQVGIARGFGQDLIPSEKFFAGGGNTVRGYAQDALGPKDFFGDPTGGNSLLVLNEEVRFPIFRWVRGVGFFDAGNVFPTIGDLSLMNLDTSVGFGVRIHTPFALLRVDYGIPLIRTTGTPFGRWYFSIGQAF